MSIFKLSHLTAAGLAAAVALAAPVGAEAKLRRGGKAALAIGILGAATLIGAAAIANSNSKSCVRKRVWVVDEDGDRYRVWRRVCR
jgi:hypothetical protein